MTSFYPYKKISTAMKADKNGFPDALTEIFANPERIDFSYRSMEGRSLLFKACKFTLRAVQFFLPHFDVNAKDKNGSTILCPIIYSGKREVLEFILPLMSAEVISSQNDYGYTAIHIAYLSRKKFIPLLREYMLPGTEELLSKKGRRYDNPPVPGLMFGTLATPRMYSSSPVSERTLSPSEEEELFMETCTKTYLEIPQEVIDGKCSLPAGFFEQRGIVNGSRIAKRVIGMLAIVLVERKRSEQAAYVKSLWDSLLSPVEAPQKKKVVCTETEEELQMELEALQNEQGDEIATALERMNALD
jgi:hypothetical protein